MHAVRPAQLGVVLGREARSATGSGSRLGEPDVVSKRWRAAGRHHLVDFGVGKQVHCPAAAAHRPDQISRTEVVTGGDKTRLAVFTRAWVQYGDELSL